MIDLLKALLPTLFLAGLFVVAVLLGRFVVVRLLGLK